MNYENEIIEIVKPFQSKKCTGWNCIEMPMVKNIDCMAKPLIHDWNIS